MSDLSHAFWQQKAQQVELRNEAFIDGKFVSAQSGHTYDVINPATEQVLAAVAACSEADVDVAVNAARRAFDSGDWSEKAPAERKAVLHRLAALVLEHQEELALLETLDMGKPVMDALNVDIMGASAILSWYAEATDKIYDEVAPSANSAVVTITREPIGVVGAIVPWNFPLDLAIWKLGPALAAGNSVIIKPAEQSPHSVLRLAELAIEAGLPAGVFSVVPGLGHESGKALGMHMDVDCVAFTGSTQVGKMFMQYSGESNMKAVWLETGGKSPNLVFADCKNLDRAADFAAQGIFFNQGEICSATSRLLVENSIKEEFVAKMIERAQAKVVGDPLNPDTTMGPIVSAKQADRISSYIEQGVNEGAELKTGGKRQEINGSGLYVEPTIFAGVNNQMVIAQEEIFGPVLAVQLVDSDEQALAYANGTDFGLAACVYTRDITKALRMARDFDAGIITINQYFAGGVSTPFGGNKKSGFGREKGLEALRAYCRVKSITAKI